MQAQQGFVLVLSLVMLTVLTLIGVTSMSSSNMQLRISANASQHQRAFDGGESLIHFLSSTVPANPIDYQIQTEQNYADAQKAAKVTFAGCSKGIGNSLEEGRGFSYSFYNIRANSSNPTGSAVSVQMQGVRYPSAACSI